MLAKVREALFNILADRVPDARFADCFSGTGAVGLEALSRGAEHVDFFESGRHALDALQRNIAQLSMGKSSTVHRSDLPNGLGAGKTWDIVMVDQPWTLELGLPVVERLMSRDRLSQDGVLVVSERRGYELGDASWNGAGLEVTDRRGYGDSSLVFLAKSP